MTDRVDMGVPDFAILGPLDHLDDTLARKITDAVMGDEWDGSEWVADRFREFGWAIRELSEKADVLIYLRQEESDA